LPHPRHVLGVIAGDERTFQLAVRGWAAINRFRIGPWRWRLGFDGMGIRGHSVWRTIGEASRSAPVSALHVIGRVEDRADGLELVTSISQEEKTRRRGLRPGDIIDRYSHVQLVILQPEPYTAWPDERFPSDREAASRMRLFAGELSADGVPLVLVLPALDTPYAARVLEKLARRLNVEGPPSADALARTVIDIQRLVAAHPGQAAVAAEACCDATLFYCRGQYLENISGSIDPPRKRDTRTERSTQRAQRLRRS
jgi:hypothetical protein